MSNKRFSDTQAVLVNTSTEATQNPPRRLSNRLWHGCIQPLSASPPNDSPFTCALLPVWPSWVEVALWSWHLNGPACQR
eukprot:5662685-Amphidinium_carterae.1